MIKYYIRFYYPGIIVSNDSVEELDSNKKIKLPKGAYAYQTFQREILIKNNRELKSEEYNHSSTCYLGECFTLEQIEKKFPMNQTLIKNMKYNNWENVVRTAQGQFFPLDKNDVIL